MSDLTDKLDRLKERRKETRDDLERSQKLLTELNDRREQGEDGLTPRIREARKTRDKREEDWREAKRAVREARRAEDALDVSPGAPHWGGSEDIILNEVVPVARAAGISRNSGKRTETYGNPGSDHHVSQVNASAADFPTANNYTLRNQIMKALGVTAVINDYGNYTIEREGHRFRVQPIAGTHGTGPHLHIGIRRI